MREKRSIESPHQRGLSNGHRCDWLTAVPLGNRARHHAVEAQEDMGDANHPADVECIEPNLVSMRLPGTIDHADLGALFDKFEPFVSSKPFFVIEVDMRETKGATPEARRLAADRLSNLPKFYIAVITAGFAQRMIARLVLTAHEMFNRGHSISGFFGDSESARAWLLERAKEHEAEA